jgi:hypothetical protein
MIRVRWFFGEILTRLGWPGLAGIALIATCGAIYACLLAPLDSRMTESRAQVRSSHGRQLDLSRMAAEQDPATQLESFYRYFGRESAPTEWLGKLHGIASANGLTLRQAEYRAGDVFAGRLAQYQVVIPLTGTYPQLKRFVASVLLEIPHASLDQFSMQRRNIGDRTVDAQMQFTFFVPEKS